MIDGIHNNKPFRFQGWTLLQWALAVIGGWVVLFLLVAFWASQK